MEPSPPAPTTTTTLAAVTPTAPGGFLGLRHLRAMRDDLLGFYTANARAHGDVVAFSVGGIRAVQLTDPAHYQEVLVDKHRAFLRARRLKRVLGQWNGNGLLLNEGEGWVRQRRLVNPAFKPQRLASYVDVVVRRTRAMLAGWKGRDELDVSADVGRLTLGVVAEALFGADVEEHVEAFIAAVAELNEAGLRELSAPVVLPMWAPTPAKRRMRRAVGRINRVVREMIGSHRAEGSDRGDLLSMLLLAVDEDGDGGRMTDEQARDEAVNLMLAGNETTATAIVWTLHLLSRHPEAQQRIRDEVAAALAGGPPTFGALPKLRALEQAIKEAMRLYPPVYVMAREAGEDVVIGGHRIARGTQVILVPYLTHHDARWFSDPEEFRPERFDREEELPRGAYLPFGLGPRACIGRAFAMMEITAALALVLSRHRLRPAGEVVPQAQVSLHPRDGLRLALT